MWVAIELATLTTVVMVGLYRTSAALEAAWKYFILGSVGIALALAGAAGQSCKSLGILAPALEARPMTCRERSDLVEEKQFGVGVAPHLAMPVIEIEPAADPLLRRPPPFR